MKSKKLIVEINSSKNDKIICGIIKDYKLSTTNKDYLIKDKIFELYNTNQYIFTDIRNELHHKGISYEEE